MNVCFSPRQVASAGAGRNRAGNHSGGTSRDGLALAAGTLGQKPHLVKPRGTARTGQGSRREGSDWWRVGSGQFTGTPLAGYCMVCQKEEKKKKVRTF